MDEILSFLLGDRRTSLRGSRRLLHHKPEVSGAHRTDTMALRSAHAKAPVGRALKSRSTLSDLTSALKKFPMKTKGRAGLPFRFLGSSIALALALMLCVQGVTYVIWPDCEYGVPCEWRKSQLEVYAEVVRKHVPPLKAHTGKHSSFVHLGTQAFAETKRDCVGPWLETLKASVRAHMGGALVSDPAVVREVMELMHLTNTSFGREAVGNLSSLTIDLESQVDRMGACARQNAPLHATL